MNKNLGQVFTPLKVVMKMISLISKKNPKILEPSSGKGAFYNQLIKKYKYVSAVEIDENVAHKGANIKDFFDVKGKYDVIIGNPPYVDFKDIPNKTLKKLDKSLLIHKPNLYMYFLEKSLQMLKKDGELIFIIPTEWLMAASASNLISNLYFNYVIQYFEILPENIWENASVTTAIIKIKKGNNHKRIPYFISTNKKIIMGERPLITYSGHAVAKVGGASGNNFKYKVSKRNASNFITSSYERTGEFEKMLYYPVLEEWIRKVPIPPKFNYQIFVNSKTRRSNPFFMVPQEKGNQHLYDASVLSIYCDMSYKDSKKLCRDLNNLKWDEMGIKRNGRFHFTQSILEGVLNG